MIESAVTIVMIAISSGLFVYWLRETVGLILADKTTKMTLNRESSRKAA